MQCDPRGAAETVTDTVLNGHVSTQRRAVVDVGCFTVGTVSTTDVVVISADDDRALQCTTAQTHHITPG